MRRAIKLLVVGVVWLTATTAIAVAQTNNNVQTYNHSGFPARPSGLSAITSAFGQPCNGLANDNRTTYFAVDVGLNYPVNYHHRLGLSSGSTLGANIWTHQRFDGHSGNILEGWWGYNCRRIANSSNWSTHAWGIAIDGNTGPEHQASRHCHYHVSTSGHRGVWTSHGYYDGIAFCDPFHMQYATNYP